MRSIKLKAPAKINLHLEVRNKRNDGFHEIFSLFQMIDLYDFIKIKKNNSCKCIIKGNFDFPCEKNIMYKAYLKYCEASLEKFGIVIKIKKNIPMEAGLGGGSSDAAAVLYALNRFFPNKLSRNRLFEIAAEIGSDVPFFLNKASAIVKGRGEIIETIERKSSYECIIIKPDFKVSTAEAYSWVDNDNLANEKPLNDDYLKNIYKKENIDEMKLFNSFTPSLIKRFSDVEKIISTYYETGAVYANVSGSGSAIFGIYNNGKARKALKKLKKQYKLITIRKPLDRNQHCI